MADTKAIQEAVLAADTSEKAEVLAQDIAAVADRAAAAEARNAVVENDLVIAETAEQGKLNLKLPEGVTLKAVQVAIVKQSKEGNDIVHRGSAMTFDLALAKAIERANAFEG